MKICFRILVGLFWLLSATTGNSADFSAAVRLSLGENAFTTSSITSDNGTNYFKFEASSNGRATIRVKHDTVVASSWQVNVFNPANKLLMSFTTWNGGDSLDVSKALGIAPGTYYVSVTASHWSLTNKQFHVGVAFQAGDNFEKSPTDSFINATEIKAGQLYGSSIKSDEGTNYFKFDVTSEGSVAVRFKHDSVVTNHWQIKVLSATNKQLMSFTSWNGGDLLDVSKTLGLAPGTYLISVTASRWNLTNEQFQIGVTFQASEIFEKSPTDSITSATQIKAGRLYSSSIKSDAGTNYYKFDVTSDGNVVFRLKHDSIVTSSWQIRVLNPANKELMSFTTWNSGDLLDTSKTLSLASGTYYISVTASHWTLTNGLFQIGYSTTGTFDNSQATTSTNSTTNTGTSNVTNTSCMATITATSGTLVMNTPCVTLEGKTYSATWSLDQKIPGGVYFRLIDHAPK